MIPQLVLTERAEVLMLFIFVISGLSPDRSLSGWHSCISTDKHPISCISWDGLSLTFKKLSRIETIIQTYSQHFTNEQQKPVS
jgi:hypothetical protein